MSAAQDWERFAAFAAIGDVAKIEVMVKSMTPEEIKACMTHGATVLHKQLNGPNPANKVEVVFPANPGLPRLG